MLSKPTPNDSAHHDDVAAAGSGPHADVKAAGGDTVVGSVGGGLLDSKVGPCGLDALLDSLDTGDWQLPEKDFPLDFHWYAYHPKKFGMDAKQFVSTKSSPTGDATPYSPSSPAYDPLVLGDIPGFNLGPKNKGTKRKSTADTGTHKRCCIQSERLGYVSV